MRAVSKIQISGLLFLLSLMVFAAGGVLAEEAQMADDVDIWTDDFDRPRRGMTQERAEKIIIYISANNPEAASSLRNALKESLDKFSIDLHNYVEKSRSEEGAKKRNKQRLERKYGDYVEWFKENYPEQAKQLLSETENDPDSYFNRVGISWRKYGRVKQAQENSPELGEVVKKDIELLGRRDRLIRKIRETEDEGQVQTLKSELTGVVHGRFDLIIEKRQIKYEQMLKKVEKLKHDLHAQKAELEKLQGKKGEITAERVEELLREEKDFKWE